MVQAYATSVDAYVAGRPEYPVALLSDLPAASTIVDLGAGTGKFTELLALTGKRIIAVEPIAEMAARIPLACLKNVEVLIGTAEAIPLPDGAADLVCCATAFHWFDYARATAEILRILAPGGALALVWNVRDQSVPWVRAFTDILNAYAGDAPRHGSGKWRVIFDDPHFRHLATSSHRFSHELPPDGIVDRALSTSFIAALPQDEREKVRAQVEGLIANEPSLSGRYAVAYPYVTELHVFGKAA